MFLRQVADNKLCGPQQVSSTENIPGKGDTYSSSFKELLVKEKKNYPSSESGSKFPNLGPSSTVRQKKGSRREMLACEDKLLLPEVSLSTSRKLEGTVSASGEDTVKTEQTTSIVTTVEKSKLSWRKACDRGPETPIQTSRNDTLTYQQSVCFCDTLLWVTKSLKSD